MLDCFVVGIGGFIGSAARYLIGKIPMKNPASFPANTLLIKSGAFFTAFVYVVASAGLGILAVMAGQCAVK